jgi:hypothetical protein
MDSGQACTAQKTQVSSQQAPAQALTPPFRSNVNVQVGRKSAQISAWNFSAEYFPSQLKSVEACTGTKTVFPAQCPRDRQGQQTQCQDPVASFGIQASGQETYNLRVGTFHPDMFRLEIDVVAVESFAEQTSVFQKSLDRFAEESGIRCNAVDDVTILRLIGPYGEIYYTRLTYGTDTARPVNTACQAIWSRIPVPTSSTFAPMKTSQGLPSSARLTWSQT